MCIVGIAGLKGLFYTNPQRSAIKLRHLRAGTAPLLHLLHLALPRSWYLSFAWRMSAPPLLNLAVTCAAAQIAPLLVVKSAQSAGVESFHLRKL